MDKETARKLIALVNNYEVMQLLDFYVASRIVDLQRKLEICTISDLQTHQGALKELRALLDLRTEVLKKAE